MLAKRIWAMMGVVYVILIVLLMTYWMATMELVTGITGIMLAPALGALSAQYFNQRWIIRHGRQGHIEEADFIEPPYPQPGGQSELVLGIVFAAATVLCLCWGIVQLTAYFRA